MLRILAYKSQFTSISDAEPHELSWENFKDVVLSESQIVKTKGSEPQYFPGEMRAEADSKGDSSVYRVHLYCLDADDITPEKYEEILGIVAEGQYECVVHSTYSHALQLQKNGNYRVRFVFPLSRPVMAGEWRIFWSNCRLAFGAVADPTTAHPSKHYLIPSMPPGREAEEARIYREFKGEPIDVDEMMTRYGLKKMAVSEMEAFDIGKERINDKMFLAMLAKSRRGDDAQAASALKAALAKNAYAEEGVREKVLFAVAGLLAHEFPRGNPDDLCEPLRYSIEYEEHNKGGPKFSEFRDKVIRRQRDILKKSAIHKMELAKEEAKIALIQGTAQEYTEENLSAYLKACGNKFTFSDLSNRLVLVHQSAFYVFDGSGYVFATKNSLLATIRKYLQFRAEANLEFSYFYPNETGSKKPPTPKNADGFVKSHGDMVKQVRYTYLGASWYDPVEAILKLSEVKSPSRIVPERVPEVELWMEAACPDENDRRRWCEWLSQYSDTSRALVGLVLTGPSGVGKSAFASGMSKMFGDAPPCSMGNYLSTFNSEILQNPLVFADESLPEINGRVPTDKLRTLISSCAHEINQKGKPIVHLDGFVRTIMAFQNFRKFDFGRGHTREDLDAIEKRFLFLPLCAEGAALFNYDLFVNNKGLAKHALYLSQNISRSSERFGVDTSGSDHVVFGDPIAMQVVDWILEYLIGRAYSAPDSKQGAKKHPVFVNKGRVFANATLIRKNWSHAVTPTKQRYEPTQQQIADAIRTIASSEKPERIRMGTGQETYWELKKNVLRSRAFSLDLLQPRPFELLMGISHELHFFSKRYKLTDAEKMERMEALKKLKGAPAKIEGAA